jgi:Tol biopolymer transport system component
VLRNPDRHEQLPAWSPDGKWIAYEENCALAAVRPDGTGRKILVPCSDIACAHFGIAWSPDSQRLAWIGGTCFTDKPGIADRVWVINGDGTGARMIFQSRDPLFAHGMIAWSPDGKSVAVMLDNKVSYLINADCAGGPNGCDESSRTKMDAFPAHWQHTFYPQWAQAAGTPTLPTAQCRIVFVGYQENNNVHIRNCDGSGAQRVTDLVTDVSAPEHPVWSPDGQRILFVSRHEGQQLTSSGEPVGSLYTIRADGTGLTRLTRNASDDQPAWSPDGTRIAFHRNCNLAVMNADGTRVTIIARPHEDLFCIDQSAWSPDGKRIAFTSLKWPSLGFLTEQAVFVVNPDGSNLTRLAAVPAENWVEYNVVWSPDGAQVAFSVAGRKYIVSADGSGEPKVIESIPDSWYPWYWPL